MIVTFIGCITLVVLMVFTKALIPVTFISPILASNEKPSCDIVVYYSANLLNNDDVGNYWNCSVFINGNRVEGKLGFKASENAIFTLKSRAVESDEISDVGLDSINIKVSNLMDGVNIFNQSVYVVENRGTYSENTALWNFKVTIIKR